MTVDEIKAFVRGATKAAIMQYRAEKTIFEARFGQLQGPDVIDTQINPDLSAIETISSLVRAVTTAELDDSQWLENSELVEATIGEVLEEKLRLDTLSEAIAE